MQLHDVAIQFSSNSLSFGSSYYATHCSPATPEAVIAEGISIPLPGRLIPRIPMAMISAVAMKLLSRKKGAQIHSPTLYEINKTIEAKTTKDKWKNQIPLEYHEFSDLFD